ncbi:MAG: hypothetical protein O4805_17080 [Trichodesmium sp. St16_bin2-tuft]|nr:hypothetical protein [Trichodesmium sp. St16_bin2-tuft]
MDKLAFYNQILILSVGIRQYSSCQGGEGILVPSNLVPTTDVGVSSRSPLLTPDFG